MSEKLVYRKGDLKLVIEQDMNPEDPRDWDNLGVMVCGHRRYTLGDVQVKNSDEWTNEAKKASGGVVLPLYLYDHSVQRISTESFVGRAQHAEWDSGKLGFIYATAAAIRKTFNVKRITKSIMTKAIAALKAEVEVYNQWLSGNIWGFVLSKVKTCDLGYDHDEEIDSCWGFYGDDFDANGLYETAGVGDILTWEAK